MKRTAAYSTLLLVMGLTASDGSYADERVEKQATDILLDACPRLMELKNASEISSLVATRRPAEDSYEQGIGWKDIVQVVVTLPDPVKSLPRDFYAAGHVCTYDVGHGGVVTAKTPCKKICNFDTSSKGAAYLDLPATVVLNLAAE